MIAAKHISKGAIDILKKMSRNLFHRSVLQKIHFKEMSMMSPIATIILFEIKTEYINLKNIVSIINKTPYM
jgi:hypothetical protein